MTEQTNRDHRARATENTLSKEHTEARTEAHTVDQRDPLIADWVLSKQLDLDAAFGFEHAEYAGPPYTQLSPTVPTLRLLVLMLGCFNDDITVFLIEVPIASRPKYVALSYVWGNSRDTVPIQLFGQEYLVTKNLAAALRHIRSEYGIMAFWVDAVCINQADVAEKNVQLAQMGSIYKDATEVLVWLGMDMEETQDNWGGSAERTKMAFDFARQFANTSYGDFSQAIKTHSVGQGYPDRDDGFRAFLNLLTRKWFSRGWIVQEVVLPHISRVRIVCGSRGTPWRAFRNVALCLTTNLASLPPRAETFIRMRAMSISTIEVIRSSHSLLTLSGGHPARLLATLLSFTGGWFEETDRRDRIFSLLGFAEGKSGYQGFKADYNATAIEVFIKFAKYLFSELRSAEFLVFLHPRDLDGLPNELPSWVPTWAGKV
jgi:hypothetical protein